MLLKFLAHSCFLSWILFIGIYENRYVVVSSKYFQLNCSFSPSSKSCEGLGALFLPLSTKGLHLSPLPHYLPPPPLSVDYLSRFNSYILNIAPLTRMVLFLSVSLSSISSKKDELTLCVCATQHNTHLHPVCTNT